MTKEERAERAELRKLAEAALPGNPITPHPCSVRCFRTGYAFTVLPGEPCPECSWLGIPEADSNPFIAAATPTTVLSLIDALEAKEAAVNAALEVVEAHTMSNPLRKGRAMAELRLSLLALRKATP